MNYRKVLSLQPWLRLCNINNVSSRLLERTSGNSFIAFNKHNGEYELHSVSSYRLGDSSCDTVISDTWLNWRIIQDYLMNNHKKFAMKLMAQREEISMLHKRHESTRRKMWRDTQIRSINRTLGRNI